MRQNTHHQYIFLLNQYLLVILIILNQDPSNHFCVFVFLDITHHVLPVKETKLNNHMYCYSACSVT